MAFSERLWGLYAKKEVTYATDAAPVATDAVMTMEPLWSRITPDYEWANERLEDANSSLLPRASAPPRGRKAMVDIAWRLRGTGSAYSAGNVPEADPLFQACGMGQTVVTTGGSESVTYAPADTGHASATIWGYGANKLYKVVGCRGTFGWAMTPGQLVICRFRMSGLLTADPTETALATQTYDATVPPAAVGVAFGIGAVNPDVASLEFQLGADLKQLNSLNAADGIAEFDMSEFVPALTTTIRTTALGTYDPMADFKAATARNLVWTIGTGVQYNRATMTLNSAQQRRMPRHTFDNAFTAWDMEMLCPSVSLAVQLSS
jgi:hypothetical protein